MPVYSSKEEALLALNNSMEMGEDLGDDMVAQLYNEAEIALVPQFTTTTVPMPLQDNAINVANHLDTIENYGLGPADPRQPNNEFWAEKAVLWAIPEGDARGRLCANCVYYINTTQITDAIKNGPAWNLKASNLPLDPPWADIESHPTAYCDLHEITCSPIRTCGSQLPGGPIDNVKANALGLEPIREES